LHPNGGYYFLLASAIGMVRSIDIEPMTRDHLILLETDYGNQCDAAPPQLIQDPSLWILVRQFCFFSGGPINSQEDVFYEAVFEHTKIFMLAFLSPALSPEELYLMDHHNSHADSNQVLNHHNPIRMSTAAVQDVESVYDLTAQDFADLKVYHMGPCRALPEPLLQPEAWTKVLPPHFCAMKAQAMQRAQQFEDQYGKIPYQSQSQQQLQQQQQQAEQAQEAAVALAAAQEQQQAQALAAQAQQALSLPAQQPRPPMPMQQLLPPGMMQDPNASYDLVGVVHRPHDELEGMTPQGKDMSREMASAAAVAQPAAPAQGPFLAELEMEYEVQGEVETQTQQYEQGEQAPPEIEVEEQPPLEEGEQAHLDHDHGYDQAPALEMEEDPELLSYDARPEEEEQEVYEEDVTYQDDEAHIVIQEPQHQSLPAAYSYSQEEGDDYHSHQGGELLEDESPLPEDDYCEDDDIDNHNIDNGIMYENENVEDASPPQAPHEDFHDSYHSQRQQDNEQQEQEELQMQKSREEEDADYYQSFEEGSRTPSFDDDDDEEGDEPPLQMPWQRPMPSRDPSFDDEPIVPSSRQTTTPSKGNTFAIVRKKNRLKQQAVQLFQQPEPEYHDDEFQKEEPNPHQTTRNQHRNNRAHDNVDHYDFTEREHAEEDADDQSSYDDPSVAESEFEPGFISAATTSNTNKKTNHDMKQQQLMHQHEQQYKRKTSASSTVSCGSRATDTTQLIQNHAPKPRYQQRQRGGAAVNHQRNGNGNGNGTSSSRTNVNARNQQKPPPSTSRMPVKPSYSDDYGPADEMQSDRGTGRGQSNSTGSVEDDVDVDVCDSPSVNSADEDVESDDDENDGGGRMNRGRGHHSSNTASTTTRKKQTSGTSKNAQSTLQARSSSNHRHSQGSELLYEDEYNVGRNRRAAQFAARGGTNHGRYAPPPPRQEPCEDEDDEEQAPDFDIEDHVSEVFSKDNAKASGSVRSAHNLLRQRRFQQQQGKDRSASVATVASSPPSMPTPTRTLKRTPTRKTKSVIPPPPLGTSRAASSSDDLRSPARTTTADSFASSPEASPSPPAAEDKNSRRALILKMAKARMAKQKQGGAGTPMASEPSSSSTHHHTTKNTHNPLYKHGAFPSSSSMMKQANSDHSPSRGTDVSFSADLD
jgi:hypothetical protein